MENMLALLNSLEYNNEQLLHEVYQFSRLLLIKSF